VVSTSAGLTSALANPAVGRIVLDPGTYLLTAQLNITRSVILEAAVAGSVVLDAGRVSGRRVLIINPGSLGIVQLIGLNITGGNAPLEWTVLGNRNLGGGVFVSSGTVTITSSSIYGNVANNNGGGVGVVGGTVTITSSWIYGNTVNDWGGGVYASSGTVTITSSSIYGNTATYGYGGGVMISSSTVTITSSSIYRNEAEYGGGVWVRDGSTVTLSSCPINGNTAKQVGGGAFFHSGSVTLVSCTINGNAAYCSANQNPCGQNVVISVATVCSTTTLTGVDGPYSACAPGAPPASRMTLLVMLSWAVRR
jgi:hypothetical protein